MDVKYLLAFVVVLIREARGYERCGCSLLCANDLTATREGVGYYHSPSGCVQLSSNCSLSASECMFSSVSECQKECACEQSQFGCCQDRSPRLQNGQCAAGASVPSDSLVVRWDVVSIGVVGSLLTVSVLLITGLAVYYRHRHRKQKRSRYIHEVLQMYDGSSDSFSDTSIDDNPESNNLFERL